MITVKTIAEVSAHLDTTFKNRSMGFVPTMGALHEGHLALVRRAAQENASVSASIFVNPIQFNNPEDLKKYPRPIEADLTMLEQAGCNMVFIPEVEEMYPEPSTEVYDFGMLDKVLEGEFRPGHFNGVAVVVKKLFQIMKPQKAYFGEKDYQQLQVIKALVKKEDIGVEIIPCATVREADGLAMSSRNVRLGALERNAAPVIYQALQTVKAQAGRKSVAEVLSNAIKQIESSGVLKVEYFALVDGNTLSPISTWTESPRIIACSAVFAGQIRLIDNLLIIS
ncbi:MAG: pantoate--beta-alanine ligase [Bacteroidota bacterium]